MTTSLLLKVLRVLFILLKLSSFTLGTYKYDYESLKSKKIIIYGAGNSSESLYNYLIKQCNCEIVAWIDKYPDGKSMKVLHDVISIECIDDKEYDFIVIAALKKNLADNMKKELVNLHNIDERKIIWNKVEYDSLLSKL